MKNKFKEDKVILEFTIPEYNRLMLFLGYALGSATNTDSRGFVNSIIKFVNEMNEGNPHYTPYRTSEDEDTEK